MKTIVAGSRAITCFDIVEQAIEMCPFRPTLIISGAALGVDTLGEQYAKKKGIPIQTYPADWNNLNVPNCKVRRGKSGRLYNVLAGFNRNEVMSTVAEAVIAIWDGISDGTADMVNRALAKGLVVFLVTVDVRNLTIIKGELLDAKKNL